MKYRSKHRLIAACLICLAFLSFTRPGEKKPFTIKTKTDHATLDNLGNLYIVKDDELLKYLANGKFFARYSNLKLGNISSVDVTNPLKLVLYYRDFQQIVFLDDQLSVNSDNVSLESLGYEQTDLVCASANNSFWIYSKQNNELLRFNESSKKIAFTGNLKQVLQTELNPNFMMEYNGLLFLNCPDNGIYVFDIFGAFSRVIGIKGLQQFQVGESILYYRQDSSLCSYNYKLLDEACKKIPGSATATDIRFNNRRICVVFKDSVQLYNNE